jgi:hypothetical protein
MSDTRSLREHLGPAGYAVTFATVVLACLALGVAVSMLVTGTRNPARATAPIAPAALVVAR